MINQMYVSILHILFLRFKLFVFSTETIFKISGDQDLHLPAHSGIRCTGAQTLLCIC